MYVHRVKLLAALGTIVIAVGMHAVRATETPDAKSSKFAVCSRSAHGVTWPLLRCYSDEMKLADDELASTYAVSLASTHDSVTQDYLAKSQASWLSFLAAWCEAVVPRSGSIARFKLFECRLSETRARTRALRDHFGR